MRVINKLLLVPILLITLMVPAYFADAYVSVKGYYRSDGTYVRPHVRSNPNGLKYDNYSWTPSQGLYNDTYGTRGSAWDTPTWITDPDYYEGKSLYESGQSGVGSSNSYTAPTYSHTPSESKNISVDVPSNASLNYYGNDWSCNSGYKTKYDASYNKIGCTKVQIPDNAHLSYSGSDWYCDIGYSTTYDSNYNKKGCEKVGVPKNAHLSYSGSDWYCDSGYKTKYDASYNKIGCTKVQIPDNAHLSYSGSDWYCDSGYKTVYNNSYEKTSCKKIRVPSNAHLNYSGSDWYCDSGYSTTYNSSYEKVGCKRN